MAEVIRMPKMSDTMTEGVIVAWHKKVGDTIQPGDILAEVETDKAVMELEAYESGTILYIGAKEGDTVPVDAILYIVGEPGESYEHLLNDGAKKAGATGQTNTNETAGNTPAKTNESNGKSNIDIDSLPIKVERMPKMSDTMTEGVIVAWHKQVGDNVQPGDILAEVETDKAVMELEAYEGGKLIYIGAKEGEAVRVNDILYILAEDELPVSVEEIVSALNNKQDTAPAKKEEKAAATVEKQAAVSEKETVTTGANGRIKASPLARRMAEELGIDLSKVKGTGEGGRIVKRDIEAYQAQAPAQEPAREVVSQAAAQAPSMPESEYEEVPVSQMRKTIARRLSESKFTAPHFYLTVSINMDKAMAARKQMNEMSPVKISFNDLVVKATAMALMKHPEVNAAWLGDKIRYHKHAHIGVAVAVPEGLVVPVIRYANQKSLSQIAQETKELAEKAKSRKLQPADWEGSTFSVSNLGMFGIEEFTAIINPPNACILAVGSIQQQPIVLDGEIKIAHIMKVTLSCDHRVVDGAVGAAFLQTLKANLEEPLRMLV
ncbi:pyruvate dehydrogenase complex dihydrolipoamide acetyltransferase [Thermonema rossianum]|uniref:pyruvate dehydrogenase complex dihydrolipoamide acetyltransferase n=1 Tax=Thermonema rossianum TaxID=55505 RepID=UPI00057018B3|nr:pyruvate dehydrogenase complex dihydrolipoamide acetyltransferase [Thermonema rossianum]